MFAHGSVSKPLASHNMMFARGSVSKPLASCKIKPTKL